MSRKEFTERNDLICKMYNEGAGEIRLGKLYRISHQRVDQILKYRGIKTRKRGRPRKNMIVEQNG